MMLLCDEEVQVSDTTEIAVMLTIVFGSIVLSTVLDMGAEPGLAGLEVLVVTLSAFL